MDRAGFDNGEYWLLVNSPIFKRRYTVDCDIVMGCTIGCQFCYYRWVAGAIEYFGTGYLKELCLPEKLAEVLEKSRLVRKDRDGIMLCARSDGSIQIDRIAAFLRAFKLRNPIFVLHRGYFGPHQLEAFGEDERVVFSTTLTPCGKDFGWTPVDESRQIEGIAYLLYSGIPPRRISVEVGPINERNVSRAIVAAVRGSGPRIRYVQGRLHGDLQAPAFRKRTAEDRVSNDPGTECACRARVLPHQKRAF